MYRKCDSHRFFIVRHLTESSPRPLRSLEGEQNMLDVILVALGFGFFVLTIGYAYACDRL